MYIHRTEIDDHTPAATAAGSVEPMRRADHKAKRHPRPTTRPAGVERTRRVRCVRRVVWECGE